jgi:hypothetical protein
MPDARIEWISIGADPAAWRAAGLVVGADGLVPFLFASLRIEPGAPGLHGWALSGIDDAITSIDGLATRPVEPLAPAVAAHPLGAIGLDHVVVLTGSLERTCGAIADATGAPLKRVRELRSTDEAGSTGEAGSMRQGFHRVGGLVVEVVERAEYGGGDAAFWGLVIDVRDLDAAVALLGPDRIGIPKDAVQPGRRIATVRSEAALGLPVALMSPPVR